MGIQSIASGLIHEWIDDKAIHVYTLTTSLSMNSLDLWHESIMNLLNSLEPDQTRFLLCYELDHYIISYLILNNYRINSIAVMPKYKAVVDAVLARHPDLIVGLALVTSNVIDWMVSFGRLAPPSKPQVCFYEAFDREDAIDWLYNLDPSKEA